MQSLFYRTVLPRAFCGLALVLLGAISFALTATDSGLTLTAMAAHLCGIALLYSAIHLTMERSGGRLRLAGTEPRPPRSGCAIALLRTLLIVAMVAAGGVWVWSAGVDLNEVRHLVFGGRTATAQVIGRDIVPANAPIGYIHYAYRASPTIAPEDRFPVPHSAYPQYRIGQPFQVTYAAADPRIHRIGRVDWAYGIRRLLYWLLLLANGGAYLYLPLWLLEFRRQRKGADE